MNNLFGIYTSDHWRWLISSLCRYTKLSTDTSAKLDFELRHKKAWDAQECGRIKAGIASIKGSLYSLYRTSIKENPHLEDNLKRKNWWLKMAAVIT